MSELSLCGKHPRDVLTPHHFSTAAAAGVEPASCLPMGAGDPRPGSAVPWHPSWADSLTWDRSQQRSLRLSFVLLFSRMGLERWPVPGCHPRPLALLILGTVLLAAHAPHPLPLCPVWMDLAWARGCQAALLLIRLAGLCLAEQRAADTPPLLPQSRQGPHPPREDCDPSPLGHRTSPPAREAIWAELVTPRSWERLVGPRAVLLWSPGCLLLPRAVVHGPLGPFPIGDETGSSQGAFILYLMGSHYLWGVWW